MIELILKTLLIYFSLTLTMRLLGKRQLGELETGELVITFLLSEIASLPITEPTLPLRRTLIPILTLVCIELAISTLMVRIPFVKRLFTARPSVIITRGRIDVREMRRVRLTPEELIVQLRQNGIFDIREVDYAIIEGNGKMSVIPKERHRQPDKSELQLPDRDRGAMHIIVSDGKINAHNLRLLNKDEDWLERLLRERGCTRGDVFFMTCNDSFEIDLVKRDGSSPSPQK